MSKNKIFTVIFAVILAVPCLAAFDPTVTLTGVLQKANEEFVWIRVPSNEKHVIVRLPRKAFGKLDGYVPGKAQVSVDITLKELLKYNESIYKTGRE